MLCAACASQMPSLISDSEVPQRRGILSNYRATVSLLKLVPREGTPMHRHDRAASS